MATTMTIESLREILCSRDGCVLKSGSHEESSGDSCALEVVSVARALAFTDDPATLDMPDLRPLNDASWDSDKQRTEHLLPVIVECDWSAWSEARRLRFVERLTILTVQQIVAELPGPPDEVRTRCREADDLDKTAQAAQAAWTAQAAEAARAAWAAAEAASSGSSSVLIIACSIWRQAAAESAQGGE